MSYREPSVAGVVLAGGSSRRFGSDKRLAKFRGKSLLIHAYETLSDVTKDVYLSVDAGFLLKEFNDQLAENEPALSENLLITDLVPNQGPLGGIYSTMNTLSTDWLLVLATDLPRVSSDSLRAVIKKTLTRHTRSECFAVIAVDDADRSQPLAACYSRRLLPYIGAALHRNELGVIRLLNLVTEEVGPRSIDRVCFPTRELLNVNRPEDLGY